MSRRRGTRSKRRSSRRSWIERVADALRAQRQVAASLFLMAVVAALLLAVLRIDVIRMRYGLAEAVATERRLVEERNELTVAMRRLRHPGRLAERARELGFVRPERVVFLSSDDSMLAEARDPSSTSWPVMMVPAQQGAGDPRP